MRKLLLINLVVLLLFTVSASAQKVEKLWESDTVLNVPESVLFADSVLYVSNVNGSPLEKNGEGYISKLSLQGEIIKKDWATGINAPKGMGVYGGYMFASDIDRVAVIDLKTGKIVNFFEFENAKFLNDIAVSSDGRVYISDAADKSIYIIHEEFSKLLMQDDKLQGVNGLYWENDYLLVGTKNNIYKVDKAGKTIELYISNTGSIDGLERVSNEFMINSDWSGKVQLVSKGKDPILLLNFEDPKYNAADIDYNPKKNIIYIPTFFGNTVAAYQLILE